MSGRFSLFWLVPIVSSVSAACLSAGQPGLSSLREGRFPAAVLELRAQEGEISALPADARARYALQRGLSELGLGNARAADHWLTLAKRADASDKTLLAPTERGQLHSAWRSLGRMPGENR